MTMTSVLKTWGFEPEIFAREFLSGIAAAVSPLVGLWVALDLVSRPNVNLKKSVARLRHSSRLISSRRQAVIFEATRDGQSYSQVVAGIRDEDAKQLENFIKNDLKSDVRGSLDAGGDSNIVKVIYYMLFENRQFMVEMLKDRVGEADSLVDRPSRIAKGRDRIH